jgi:predicted 3-demethylubiquinone-9 3-methyltransferase (glyoxalase superfamily)
MFPVVKKVGGSGRKSRPERSEASERELRMVSARLAERIYPAKTGVSIGIFQNLPRITPFRWFDSNAEEAVEFYLTVFKNLRGLNERHNIDESKAPKGGVLTIAFERDGQTFTALNGGPIFKLTEAISFVVRCDSQQEVDDYLAKLTEGGSEIQCGWLKDKFGFSWQIVPASLQSDGSHAADEEDRYRRVGTRERS